MENKWCISSSICFEIPHTDQLENKKASSLAPAMSNQKMKSNGITNIFHNLLKQVVFSEIFVLHNGYY